MKFSLSRTHSCTMGAILMISGLVPITMAILIGCLCKSRITNREDTGRSFRVHDEPLWHSAGNQFRLAHIFLNLDKGSAERDAFRYARLRKNTLRFA